jgi:hypothetical protein
MTVHREKKMEGGSTMIMTCKHSDPTHGQATAVIESSLVENFEKIRNIQDGT